MNVFIKDVFSNFVITKLITLSRPARTVILMFHDLREDGDFENWLRVSVSDFNYQLNRLRQIGDFIGPDDLFRIPVGHRPRFMVTFDDGYYNNFKLAGPILQKQRVPAIFFISTQHMLDQQPFWPDIITTPIQALQLESLDLRQFDFDIFKFQPVSSPRRWDDIQKLLVALKDLGNADHPTVAAILRHLQSKYGETLAMHLPRFRSINTDELQLMAADPLFYFGSHSHAHEILTYLDDETVETNLQTSRRILHELTGQQIKHLAFPNGNYDTRIIGHAEKAGYTHAYTVKNGIVESTTPVMSLPRLGMGGVGPRSLPFFQLNKLFTQKMMR